MRPEFPDVKAYPAEHAGTDCDGEPVDISGDRLMRADASGAYALYPSIDFGELLRSA